MRADLSFVVYFRQDKVPRIISYISLICNPSPVIGSFEEKHQFKRVVAMD